MSTSRVCETCRSSEAEMRLVIFCDYCGKSQFAVELIIVSPLNGMAICSGCVSECVGIIEQRRAQGIAAAAADETRSGSAEGKSPVGDSRCAQPQGDS